MGPTRRAFLRTIAAIWITRGVREDRIHLIAHRGGVVDDQHAENSPGSLEAAIARGYWMIEVDIRRTADGHPLVHHDATFERFYGDPRAVGELSLDEVRRLRSTPGGTRPLTVAELCALCAGRTRLMLDIKGRDHPAAFYDAIGQALRGHGLFRTAYLLGGAPPGAWNGAVPRAGNRHQIHEAAAAGEDVSRRFFRFELASELDEGALALSRSHGVTPVAAVNRFRYEMAGGDHWMGAAADAQRLRGLDVRHFQIDSIYEPLFT